MSDLYNIMPMEMRMFGHVFGEAKKFCSNDAVNCRLAFWCGLCSVELYLNFSSVSIYSSNVTFVCNFP